jgi:hypothetical protein
MSEAVSTNVAAGGDKVMQLCALGVGLWVVGVVSAHLAAPFGAFTAGFAPALLIISVPVAWACVRLIARFGGRTTLLEATALASTPALLLDGVAFTWLPHLYSVVETEQRQAAAWLLWFVGAALAIACVRTARRSG